MGIFWFLRSSYRQCTMLSMARSNGPNKDGRKRREKTEKVEREKSGVKRR